MVRSGLDLSLCATASLLKSTRSVCTSQHGEALLLVMWRATCLFYIRQHFLLYFLYSVQVIDKQMFIGNLIPIIALLMRKCITVFSVASCIRRNDSYACYRNIWKNCIYLCRHSPTPPPLLYFFTWLTLIAFP